MQDTNNPRAVIGNNGSDVEKLRSIVERLRSLDAEKKALASDEKDILSEAKAANFQPKAIRSLIKRLNADPEQLAKARELEEAVDRLEHMLTGNHRVLERAA